jgi:murein L,D-transpeptidase YafK
LVYESPNFLSAADLKQEAKSIASFVESWRLAWSSKNHTEYAGKYSQDFFNSEGRSYQGWMEHKRRVAQGYKQIEITLTDLKIFRHREMITVSFNQNYNGDNRFKSVGFKRLYLKKTDSGFSIAGEEYSPLPGPQPEKWLTAQERNIALTTPPLAVAQLSEPLASAAAGSLLPSEPIEVASAQLPSNRDFDDAQAAADETARAALESLSAGQEPKAQTTDVASNQSVSEDQENQDQENQDQENQDRQEVNREPEAAPVSQSEPTQSPSAQTEPKEPGQGEPNQADAGRAEPDSDSRAAAETAPASQPESQEAQIIPTAQQAQQLVEDWLSAWSAKDQERYFSFYAPSFHFPDLNLRLASFKRYRGQLISRASSIKVEADDLKVTVSGAKATVTFEQRYQSDLTKDRGLKTLELVAVNGLWKINSETFKALP